MPMQIEIKGLANINKTAKGLKNAAVVVKEMLLKESERFTNKAVANIKENYLSGPRPERLGVVTGRLRSSIRYLIQAVGGKQFNIRLGTDLIYARAHEYGYEARGLRKRPFLRPGTEDKIPELKERIEEMLERVAKGAISV